jgi:AbrB family looped-hinge helix DNA binding protein
MPVINTDDIAFSEATVIRKQGTAIIPKPVRDLLKLAPGDYIQWVVLKDGTLIVKNVYRKEVPAMKVMK